MSPLEDEIRGALGAEATRLREVRPLCLPPVAAHPEPSAAPRARWLRSWLGPAAAAVAVVLVAAALVTIKSLTNEHATPAPSPGSIAGPPLPAGATPRYYVAVGPVRAGNERGWGINAGDAASGKTIGSFLLLQGEAYTGAVSGAADDRTFVVTSRTAQLPSVHVGNRILQAGPRTVGPTMWYLVRLFPGSADPVRVTGLPIQSPAGGGIDAMALSGDGTELAVASTAGPPVTSVKAVSSVKTVTLRVYSVATGWQQHAWSATLTTPATDFTPVTDPSWVGDSTVGFAVSYAPEVREEVRTLDVSAAGTDLLADSRVVWSQDVPEPGGGYREGSPQACDTPFLTANGQVVVCATSTYSARDKRLSATWLAYPVATPARARIIGTVPQPTDVSSVSPATVEWTNPSGTEVIGTWNPSVVTSPGGDKTTNTTNFEGVIGGGAVRPFPRVPDPLVAW